MSRGYQLPNLVFYQSTLYSSKRTRILIANSFASFTSWKKAILFPMVTEIDKWILL